MSTTSPKPTSTNAGKKLLVPPEEEFWKRYSPHHEAPLSGVTSVAVHALFIGLAILVVKFVKDKLSESEPPTVRVGKIVPGVGKGGKGGGGGGDPLGKKEGGPNLKDDRGEEKGSAPEDDLLKVLKQKELQPVQKEVLNMFPDTTPTGRDFVINPTDTVGKLAKLSKGIRNSIRRTVNPGVGQGGSGSGGGRDSGKGKGEGSGEGDGKGGNIINEREARVLRWSLLFKTNNGVHYARQLHDLGAIIAVPVAGMAGQYRVIDTKDLIKSPARGQIKDVSGINRIYWIDDRAPSVRSLAVALQWQTIPTEFVAFFPESLEKKLLRIEMAFARKKFGNLFTEGDIRQTRFDVVPKGGSYDVVVQDVIPKRGR